MTKTAGYIDYSVTHMITLGPRGMAPLRTFCGRNEATVAATVAVDPEESTELPEGHTPRICRACRNTKAGRVFRPARW